MSCRVLREWSAVLKAASAASTPAGNSSAMVRDEETAAAAKEPVHTPRTYEVAAMGKRFDLSTRFELSGFTMSRREENLLYEPTQLIYTQ
jgi:hypothetical protein